MIDFRPLSPKATSIESSRNVEIYQKSTFRLHTFECNVSWESNKQASGCKNLFRPQTKTKIADLPYLLEACGEHHWTSDATSTKTENGDHFPYPIL